MLLLLLMLAGAALWFIANYWLKIVFVNNRLFWVGGFIVILFLTSFFYSWLFQPGNKRDLLGQLLQAEKKQ